MTQSPGNTTAAAKGPLDGFRADLQGVRAVAVVAVLLYHCGFSLFSGGYVGVDMFFALSGFLMTALLLKEKEHDSTISFRGFYARRIRRLLPASITVLLCTALVSWLVLYPLEMREVSAQLAAAGAYVVNMLFARQGSDYLGGDVGSSPVLHYWSLAVEEQFYIVWPVLFAVLAGRARVHLNRIRIGLAVLTVLSFGAAVVLTRRSQPWAFYSLPTRAWEFAIGGIAAVMWYPLRRLVARLQIVIGALATIGVIAAVVLFDGRTVFPGPWAALPAVATIALILVGSGPGVLASLLRSAPMQWIGDRSYSLYLWHWPALVLVPKALGRATNPWGNLAIVVVSGLVAAVGYEIIEQPLRFSKTLWNPRHVFGLGVVLTGLGVVVPMGMRLGTTIIPTGPDASAAYRMVDGGVSVVMPDVARTNPVPSNLEPSLSGTAKSVPVIYRNGCHVDFLETEPKEPCRFGDPESRFVVVLFGDSHAAQWFPALEKASSDNGWALVSFTKSGCPSSDLTLWSGPLNREYTECNEWRRNTVDRLNDMHPDLVVLANRSRNAEDEGGFSPEELARATARTIKDLTPSKAHVVEIGPIPHMDESPVTCLSGHLDDANACSLSRSVALPQVLVSEARGSAIAAEAGFIDPTPWLCTQLRCPVVIGQYLVYRDGSHLSEEYAEWLSEPLASAIDKERPR